MEPPAGFAQLQALSAGQCVLLASDGLLRVQATALWLDSLYVRLRAPNANFKQFIAMSDADSQLYLSRVSMQARTHLQPRLKHASTHDVCWWQCRVVCSTAIYH